MSTHHSAEEEPLHSGFVLAPHEPIVMEPSDAAPLVEFYPIDGRKLRWAEWHRTANSFTATLGWGLGRLGVNAAEGQREPVVRDFRGLQIPNEELAADVWQHFAGPVAELCALGFGDPVFYRVVNQFNGYEDFAALLAGPSGHTLARVFWSRALAQAPIRPCFEIAFLSLFGDGRSVWTANQLPRQDRPAEVIWQHRAGVSLAEMLQSHEAQVLAVANGAVPESIETESQRWAVYNAYEHAILRFQVARGLLTPPTAAEATQDAAIAGAESVAVERGSRFPEAWAELQKQEAPKASAINGSLLLLVTVLISATVGFGDSSPTMIALILVVLFVHELGHYLAMRIFGYRNVKMFFLPGFGAAVTGRNHNVAGWKKAIVSLLGPVPGIWGGAVLAGFAMFAGNDLLLKTALIFISLNALNLLPILPLDGGWFWNSVLFSRAPWLEITFKVFAVICGFAASAADLGRIWMYLGIFTLIGLPAVWAQAQAVARLRRDGLVLQAGADDRIPFETAETIFGELDTRFQGKLNAKTMATSARQIFERLNEKAPNWWQSLVLSVAYFASLLVALIGFAAVGVYQVKTQRGTSKMYELLGGDPAGEWRGK